ETMERCGQPRHTGARAQGAYVRQKEQLGLGHAVLMAKELIGNEPFAVILSDDVVVSERAGSGQLMHAYSQTHSSVVAVMEVPEDQTDRYGIIRSEPAGDDLDHRRVQRLPRVLDSVVLPGRPGVVEKPPAGAAPSTLAIIGRYVLPPKIFEKLEQTPRGSG